MINVRKLYPDLPLLIKAKNVQHKERLETMFGESVGQFISLPVSQSVNQSVSRYLMLQS